MNRRRGQRRKQLLREVTNDAVASVADTLPSSSEQMAVPPQINRSLFHYTTADGIIGILQDQSLYATHAGFLNDSTECRSILAVLLPRLEAELREVVPRLVNLKLLQSSILTEYGDEIYKQEAETMLRAMTEATNSTAPYFITSFCIHEPNTLAHKHGLLSQWRGYARGGFAIEFDELALDDLNKQENKRYRYQGLITEKVIYRDHEYEVGTEKFAGFAGALLKNLFPKIADKLTDVLGAKVTNDFSRPFLSTAPFLKNESFQEENEYRIVALCNRPSVKDKSDQRDAKPIKFRSTSSGQIIPFISLYQELKIKLPIKSIVVGPHLHRSAQRAALEILLEKCGIDVPIRFSEIPFRD
jgi:hypothetical protein